MDFIQNNVLWFKALHVISVIAWMAAILYLPRLFVYHVGAEAGSTQSNTFKIMERRLSRAIMTPAMVASWIFGLILVATPGVVDWSVDFWFHAKFLLVIVLSGLHGFLSGRVRAFAEDRNSRSAGFYRAINEIPTVIMIAVVVLVIVRPF